MIRNAVKQGPSTIMVSLPSQWVKKNNIVKGDPLYLEELDGSLILNTKQKAVESKEIALKINTRKDYCPRLLTMPYLQGYDVIKVNFKDPAVLNEIEAEIKYLLGFEIITTTENSCVIKNITNGIESEFDNMLNRMMNILFFLGKEISNYVKKDNYENILLLKSAEVESNKLSLLCRRMFNTKAVRGERNKLSLYTMVTLMEAIADEYRFIIEYLDENKPKLHNKTKKFLDEVNGIVKTFNKLFIKFDYSTFVEFREQRQDIEKRKFKQLRNLSKDDVYIAHKLYNIMELVHHATYF